MAEIFADAEVLKLDFPPFFAVEAPAVFGDMPVSDLSSL
jgi:hypothetical protein